MNKRASSISLFEKILGFFKRSSSEVQEVTPPKESQVDISPEDIQIPSKNYPIIIYESELKMIGLDSASWETETGGDLFGVWDDVPIIYLASLTGPNAVRNHAHFRLDVEYLRHLSTQLDIDWGLRYFGDWHSHHSLGLSSPSTGDQKRIVGLSKKNNFDEMAEFIITFANSPGKIKNIKINPFVYADLPSYDLTDGGLIVLKGLSPVRAALIALSEYPEQNLNAYSSFNYENLLIPVEKVDKDFGNIDFYNNRISEKLIAKLVSQLNELSYGQSEIHKQPFGFIVVIPMNQHENVAFAIAKDWPNKILQVNWINRLHGTNDEIDVNISDMNSLNIDELKKITLEVKEVKLYKTT